VVVLKQASEFAQETINDAAIAEAMGCGSSVQENDSEEDEENGTDGETRSQSYAETKVSILRPIPLTISYGYAERYIFRYR
jgi:hypothetical protein